MVTTNAMDAGPLQLLIGTWQGNTGRDIAPEPDGSESNAYRERIVFNPVRPLSNAEEQRLIAVQYHQVVHRISDNRQIHDQCGYWLWDGQAQCVMHSFTIPRGLALVAGGSFNINDQGLLSYQVRCAVDDPHWPIAQSTFLDNKAKTLSFEQTLTVQGDELLYRQTTLVNIYGKEFEHTDENRLIRVG